ncbi:ion transporter [Synoicihabitans lomoniglobus]|uniref:Ion transporter n=1 Tax=Synoicihabitans lomoniglobus TaxID=2909285 RepID=A0AAE9ZX50_9BACT|nr:ion transporter [Opitutaceae bacterium LMO-M01]WED64809.1 ion transporter [Opitutaceae bacterium LMO-M01]
MSEPKPPAETSPLKEMLHEVIFEADTTVGRWFDLIVMAAIVASVLAVCLESVRSIREAYGEELHVLEWVITIMFTVEYAVRLFAVRRPWRYVWSFYGVIDLMALLPTYLSLVFAGTQSLLVVRAFRLLRIFRILKLTQYIGEARLLKAALLASSRKITVFLGVVLTCVLIAGAMMYLIEGEENGFTSIPRSIYWAIVTMTTVGYGDIAPHTVLGQFVASIVMILGYGVIAVPTGIVTVAMSDAFKKSTNTQACPACGAGNHADDARFCKYCGDKL